MRPRSPRLLIAFVSIAIAACPAPVPWEGAAAGECADGADNDVDGLFDCADPDCEGAPDCEDVEPEPVVDCAQMPEGPESSRIVPGGFGWHGLVFAADGALIGSDNSALIRTLADGSWEAWRPGMRVVEQMDRLPGGDLVISWGFDGWLQRLTPAGGLSMLDADLYAYSVRIGPQGRIWSAGSMGVESRGVVRSDPETGERTTIAMLPPGGVARTLGFSRTFDALYIGTAGGYPTGHVFRQALDAELDPVGEPELFADGVGLGWLDAIAVDACDHLYVPDSHSYGLYRISPDGDVDLYVDWSDDETGYGHDARWGSAAGGWRTDALYLPMPYGTENRVQEIVVGVPPASYEGVVLNRVD